MVDFPTAYTFFADKMLKILETKVLNKNVNSVDYAQVASVSKDGIELKTKEGTLLIKKVKPESKGIMNAYDFANGAKIKAGVKFGE